MFSIQELVASIVVIIAFFLFILIVVRLTFENKRLKKDVAQGLIDQFALMQKLEDSYKNTDNKKIEETEGFLRFVSQSRDWAFQYIERVQVAIKNFQDVFHPFATDYYKDKSKPIGQDEFGKIFEAYKKLVDELPDEGKKK